MSGKVSPESSPAAMDTSAVVVQKDEFLFFVSFVEQAVREQSRGYSKKYEYLILELSKHLEDGSVAETVFQRWINVASLTVGSLSRESSRFVELVLSIDFIKFPSLEDDFCDMVENLISAHPCHVVACLSSLISRFANPEIKAESVHTLIQSIIDIVPTCVSNMPVIIKDAMPHFQSHDVKILVSYLSNTLIIMDYLPVLVHPILELCLMQLINMDVEIQVKVDDMSEEELDEIQSKIFGNGEEDDNDNADGSIDDDDDDEQDENLAIKLLIEKLDLLLFELFSFLASRYRLSSLDQKNGRLVEGQKSVFVALLSVFERTLLRTFQSRYTQFVIFYFASLNIEFSDMFLGLLARKLFDETGMSSNSSQASVSSGNLVHPNSKLNSTDPVVVSSVSYMASFLSRSKYLDPNTFRTCYFLLLSWVENYISSVCSEVLPGDKKHHDTSYSKDWILPDSQRHSLFYSVCQALFYVFCFRHPLLLLQNEDEDDKVGGDFMKMFKLKTRFERIINCKLNPLLVCLPNVVEEFARISAKYNFVYCFSIIESNKNMYAKPKLTGYLENFFPFDPYHLKKSKRFIIDNDLYVEWDDDDDDDEDDDDRDDDEEEDDRFGMISKAHNNSSTSGTSLSDISDNNILIDDDDDFNDDAGIHQQDQMIIGSDNAMFQMSSSSIATPRLIFRRRSIVEEIK